MGIFSNIRQRRVDAGKPILFPGIGTIPTATPGSVGAQTQTPQQTADDLKEQERQRQLRITEGRGKIDAAFSRFNDGYFGQFANDFTNYYTPQIEDQYSRAVGTTRAALKNRGIDQSTVAGGAFSDLFRDKSRANIDVANNAAAGAASLRGNVERTKTDLYGLNESAADPAAANARATAEATALVAPPTTSPLGQIFAASLQPIVAGVNAYKNRAIPYAPVTGTTGSRGSGTVVR